MGAIAFLLQNEDDQPTRRPRVFKDRSNPIDLLPDNDIIERYRFPGNKIYEMVDIVRHDVESPTYRNHALPALLQVLVALRYFAKGDFFSEVADLHGISKSSVSRCVTRVSDALVLRLNNIKFPMTEDQLRSLKTKFFKIARVPNVIGAVDGTLVPIIAPKDNEPDYVCRKGYHALNIQAVVDNEMRFTNVVAKFPGSVHDSFIFNTSERRYHLEESNQDGWLLGDSGYGLKRYLMTPKLNPSTVAEENYNKAHSRTRMVVERAFGIAKSRFRCIHKTGGCLPFTPSKSAKVVTAVLKLHNKCIDDHLPEPDLCNDGEDDFGQDVLNEQNFEIPAVGVQAIRERLIQRF